MPDNNISVRLSPVSFTSSPSLKATVANAGPETVYYKRQSNVTITSNEGSLAKGESLAWSDGPRWFISKLRGARVFVSYSPEATTDMATQAELEAVTALVVKPATDDTAGLQASIDAAIAAGLPWNLRPAEYSITSGLVAKTKRFIAFGAGAKVTKIIASKSNFDWLTIGPGAEGSGSGSSGKIEGLTLAGGSAEEANIYKAGIGKTTGKAALKLSGMREFAVNDFVVEGHQDIAIDQVNNCFGTRLDNVRVPFDTCRVGINYRVGSQSGSDCIGVNAWIAGTVAGVICSGDGGGFRFYGGQVGSGQGAAGAEDARGSVILGWDYLEEKEIGSANNIGFYDIDFEGGERCWVFRTYGETVLKIDNSSINGSDEAKPLIGFLKATEAGNSRIELDSLDFLGDFSAKGSELLKVEGGFSGRQIREAGTGGSVTANGEAVNLATESLVVRAKAGNAFAFSRYHFVLNKLMFRQEGGLQMSRDWGVTWEYIGSNSEEVASANTMTIGSGISLVKVSGTTEIKKITATVAGHVVVLKFASTAKLIKGENLKIPATIEPTADDCYTLVCDGTNWYGCAPLVAN